MASRARKRVHALRRAPDGSAFQKCEHCGILVAIAILDMHECYLRKGAKKSKVEVERSLFSQQQEVKRKPEFNIDKQPRSPFCCFMESFKKECNSRDFLEIDRRGFNAWQNMSKKERTPYFAQAKKVNSAYFKILLEESNNLPEVDDEADSTMVGKYDRGYDREKSESSEGGYNAPWTWRYSLSFHSGSIGSFHSSDREAVKKYLDD